MDEGVFKGGRFLRNIVVSFEDGEVKGGEKDGYGVGVKLKDGGWV